MSQAKVAATMRTSQSAIARMESAQENITLDTLARLIFALKGRLLISIPPREYAHQQRAPWWELLDSPRATAPWQIVSWATACGAQKDQVIIAAERIRNDKLLLPEGKTQLTEMRM